MQLLPRSSLVVIDTLHIQTRWGWAATDSGGEKPTKPTKTKGKPTKVNPMPTKQTKTNDIASQEQPASSHSYEGRG